MTLTTLWIEQRSQLELEKKNIKQIIAFAGDGKLRDNNSTSNEFREFLSQIPTDKLKQYLNECLSDKFDDNGYVLQDIVNQIGRRLGFNVIDGRYRGTTSEIGFDGIWIFPEGHTVIIEVKTTDIYQINLDTLSSYRKQIITQGNATEENSSILIIIGREDRDTAGLEAQIRGSRFAWNMRIISVDTLVRLLTLKEEFDDPLTIQQISSIFIPHEFTKLDAIINLVFASTEDLKEESPFEHQNEVETNEQKPVAFNEDCIQRIEKQIQQQLIKRSKTTYSNAKESTRLSCAVSKEYSKNNQIGYWFSFHPYQKEFIQQAEKGFVAFGCGSVNKLLLIPFQDFSQWLDTLNTTSNERRSYWHVIIQNEHDKLYLTRKKGSSRIELNRYLL